MSEVMIGVIEYNEAKRLKAALSELKIEVTLVGNPQTCATKGCKITVEVHARESDLPAIGEHIRQDRLKSYEGLDVNPELHGSVFDSEQESATCPACGATFSTTLKACPDCGLVFVPDELAVTEETE